jgi:tetratricopeptide (TPR) repeat protein
VPGWHKATESLQKEGKIKTIGIIEEQHPDRCRLFMQWKEMDWPILVDPLNLLDVDGVPITIFIDEVGIIRYINPRLDNADEKLKEFINSKPFTGNIDDKKKSEKKADTTLRSDNPQLPTEINDQDSINLTMAIQKYNKALSTDSDNGRLHFRLGVLYRKRYDSQYRQTTDFQMAIKHWQKALDINPNQYIWRRRIQQYGPRLDKPYPFYDWIPKARAEIIERGQIPEHLTTEPGGAEYTKPLEIFTTENISNSEPDPDGKIYRDIENFINVECVVVPSTDKSKNSSRVHLNFTPNENIKAHWNNEVEGIKLWINPPSGWEVDNNYIIQINPGQEVSKETRHIEFEITGATQTTAEKVFISTYALYYVCEDVSGICLYRRQDIPIQLNIGE